jgi:hypothetical protein
LPLIIYPHLAKYYYATTSSAVSIPSTEIPPTSHKLLRSKMSSQIPGVRSLNLSLKQVQKATRKFSPSLKISESPYWAIYKGILPDNQIVVVRRAKKVVSTFPYSVTNHLPVFSNHLPVFSYHLPIFSL